MNQFSFNAPLSDLSGRLALVLLHSLWQASSLAAVLWLVLRCLAAERAQLRYRLSVAALAMFAILPPITWSFLAREGRQPAEVSEGDSNAMTPEIAVAGAEAGSVRRANRTDAPPASDAPAVWRSGHRRGSAGTIAYDFAAWSKVLVAVWLGGVLIMLSRVLLSVRAGRRLVRAAKPLDAAPVLCLVDELRARLGLLRRVQVKVCAAVNVPAVLGVLWPVLLVPPAFATGLPIEQLRVILVHELAHVRRYDYLFNLGQLLVEAVFFFNPAVWWISRRVRVERESCCDALARLLTGEPLAVAHTLVACAQAACERERNGAAWWPRPATAQAYHGGGSRGTLFERVRRVVVPDEIPRVRLPWYTLVGLLAIGCVVLVGLEQGGELVVQAAAKLLSPEERVEKLAEVEKEYAQPSEAPAQPAPKFHIAGRVRMADGSPLPKSIDGGAKVIRRGYMGTQNLPLDASGRFSKEFHAERVYVRIAAKNLAPTFAGPFSADAEDINLLVNHGFPTRIRFVNEAGESVPGVALEQIVYAFRSENGEMRMGEHQSDKGLPSDAEGYITLDDRSHWPSVIDARGNGYQFDRQEHQLRPDEAFLWKLARARPTTGTVLDDATGKPIEGAQFYLAARLGFADVGQDPRGPFTTAPRLAVSGAKGRFKLDSLRDDCQYAIYIRADKHAPKVLSDLRSGWENVEARLGPALYIKGQVKGDLDRLQVDGRTQSRSLQYRNPIKWSNSGFDDLLWTDVRVEDGVGYFEITDLFPGPVTLEFPGRAVSLDVTAPIDNYVIDLDQPASPETAFDNLPKRSVVLRFDLPPDAPAPRGQLRVGVQFPSSRGLHDFREQYLDVTAKQLRFDATVGYPLFYDGDKLVGYWIENHSHIEVPAGEGPLEITIAAVPAGGIFGRVRDWDGQPATNCKVHLITVEKSPRQQFESADSVDVQNTDGRFVLQVPLAGRYRLLAQDSRSEALALSEILAINEQNPLQDIELRLVEGVTLTGQVLDPDGAGVPGANLPFEFALPRHSMNRLRVTTDSDGRFHFDHVDPRLPGQYTLNVQPRTDLCGASLRIDDPARPLTIKLERGRKLHGVLLDGATSQPLANTQVTALPAAGESRVRYPWGISVTTDALGRFKFQNLELARYQLLAPGANKLQIVGSERSSQTGGAVVQSGQQAPITLRTLPPAGAP